MLFVIVISLTVIVHLVERWGCVLVGAMCVHVL